MRNIHHSLRLLSLAASLAAFSSPLAAKTVKIFILAGQSNMEGMEGKDLRKDLNAPNLPVVIGELGTCGVDKRGDFQAAQAAIAKLPEFEGTVVFVETAQYLDLVAVQWFNEGLWKKGEEERKKFETVASGRPYHYYGSGKTFFLKGVAFGEAMVKLKKH